MNEPHDEPRKEGHTPRRGIGRRDLLMGGVGVVAGLGAGVGVGAWALFDEDGTEAAKELGEAAGAVEEDVPPEMRRFFSTDLATPEVTTWVAEGARPASGLVFTTPRTTVFHGLVFDDDGEPVWIQPDGQTITDLRVQTFRGKPVMTYWAGEVATGTGVGVGMILDERYEPVATVRSGNGVFADLHEFRLTSQGTALLVSYPVVSTDLSPIDGPEDGYAYGCRVQEVDVASGRVLLDWSAHDHIELTETYEEVGDDGESPEKPFDPVHVNSVEEHGDALLLCARHTSALYLIDRRSGEIRWRFGGKKSDFEIPEDGSFEAQHDARFHPDGTLTLFDNHGSSESSDAESAALEFVLDEKAMTCTLKRALRHDGHYGYAMGNAERLPGGHTLVGWGTDPSLTEFDETDTAIFEATGLGKGTYRAYRAEWTGRPTTDPDVAVVRSDEGLEVHVSWNGATEVARWRVLTGTRAGRLAPAATARRTGFETVVKVRRARHVAVEALDARGKVLGTSRVLRV